MICIISDCVTNNRQAVNFLQKGIAKLRAARILKLTAIYKLNAIIDWWYGRQWSLMYGNVAAIKCLQIEIIFNKVFNSDLLKKLVAVDICTCKNTKNATL